MKFANSAELIFANHFGKKEQPTALIPQKKKYFFGYKVHAVTTSEGAVKSFEITSANVDDCIADKGYQSHNLEKNLADIGISLLDFRQMIFKMRRRIETDFSQLSAQFNIERV